MSKNPNKRTKSVKRDEPMNGAMKFFLAGCVAELYLLLIRRFYINADSEIQRIAWYDSYLWILTGVGAAILAAGLLCAWLWRNDSKKRLAGLGPHCGGPLCGGGAGSGPLEHVLYDAADGPGPCADPAGHSLDAL